MKGLPELSDIEQAHQHKLIQVIQNQITQAGGKIPFSEFMAACLYTPGLGYYSAGAVKMGRGGDFVTAPEISTLFGQTLAEYYATLKAQNFASEPLSIIELGAGTGKLAGDILTHLDSLGRLPTHYYILDISADLKHQQQLYLKNKLPHYFDQITWLNSLENIPHFNGNGLLIANEVIDALPVELFSLKFNDKNKVDIFQHWISNHPSLPNTFEQIILPADTAFEDCIKSIVKLDDFVFDAPEYVSEMNLNILPWLSGIEKMLVKGQLIFIDYGYGTQEYYHAARHMGTLLCYHKHLVHSDFLLNIGLQDITAYVNFTQVAMAAKTLDLTIDNYTTQAEFLLSQNLGPLAEKKLALAALSENSAAEHITITNEMHKLTAPHEMGELFKVLILQKGEFESIPSGRPHFHRL